MDGVHHQVQRRVDDAAGVFGIEVASEGSEAGQVGKERSDSLALAVGDPTGFQRRLLSADALGEMRRGVTGWRVGLCWGAAWCGERGFTAFPDEHFAVFVDSQLLDVDEFFFQCRQGVVIEIKLDGEGSIGQPPATAQKRNDLIDDLIKPHTRLPPLSLCISSTLSWGQYYHIVWTTPLAIISLSRVNSGSCMA